VVLTSKGEVEMVKVSDYVVILKRVMEWYQYYIGP